MKDDKSSKQDKDKDKDKKEGGSSLQVAGAEGEITAGINLLHCIISLCTENCTVILPSHFIE
jgi:hypothetical protein